MAAGSAWRSRRPCPQQHIPAPLQVSWGSFLGQMSYIVPSACSGSLPLSLLAVGSGQNTSKRRHPRGTITRNQRLLPSWYSTQPICLCLRTEGPQGGSSMLFLQAVFSWTPWIKAQPPNAHQCAPLPDLAPQQGSGFPNHSEVLQRFLTSS